MTSFGLIFVAFGVGLDPRQREVFGPALSPILVRTFAVHLRRVTAELKGLKGWSDAICVYIRLLNSTAWI